MLPGVSARLLRAPEVLLTCQRLLNCNRAAVCRVHRLRYPQLYPTMVVLSDGSTISARYHEPRKIVRVRNRDGAGRLWEVNVEEGVVLVAVKA